MKKIILLTLIALLANFVNAQWQQTTGPNNTVVSLIISGGDIFAGCSSISTYNGAYKSSNNGTDWTSVRNDGLDYSIKALAVNGIYIFAAQFNDVYLSSNKGINWTKVSSGLPNYAVNALAANTGKIYAGTFGVYSSSNNGLNWTKISNTWNEQVYALAIYGDTIFAGTMNGIHLSTNGGTYWTTINNGLINTQVSAILKSGTAILAGTNGGVYISNNNGANWSITNLTDPISTFTVNESHIFAGSSSNGVFKSENSGATWTEMNEGLTAKNVYSLALNNDYIFAGTSSRVWRRLLSDITTDIDNKIVHSENFKLFPNPASQFLNINFSNYKDQNIKAEIYDMVGKLLYSEELSLANTNINVSGLYDGVYILKLYAKEFTDNKKIVIKH